MSHKKRILVVSFGTSHIRSLHDSIGAIENAIAEASPACEVRSAFTSHVILSLLKKKGYEGILPIEEELEKAERDGVSTLYIQPTHLLCGKDYQKYEEILEVYRDSFSTLITGEPLMSDTCGIRAVSEAIYDETREFLDGSTAVCLVGHGVDADSNLPYEELQTTLHQKGCMDYFVGVLKEEPSKESVLQMIREKGCYQKVVLVPLMIVAGAHALTEMAGEDEECWNTFFRKAGYEVECVLKGLGEYDSIREIFAERVQKMIEPR